MTLLELRGITKTYPGVRANDDIDLDIAEGEIQALLGENGAGKSTLVKIIYGLVKPDSGAMLMRGAQFAPADPKAARHAGIGMVFQHFSLFDAMTVAENIALGMEAPPRLSALSEEIRRVSKTYGLPLDPEQICGALSAGERQRIEIIRCLLGSPKLLIMDEPTSVLTPQEADTLFDTLRRLASEGTSILYISHKLDEIRALCDRATILRGGKRVGECIPRETSARAMAEQMVGRSLSSPQRHAKEVGPVLLSVAGLATRDLQLRDVTFDAHAGEILGIGGVAGNGQEALLAAIAGERTVKNGSIALAGVDVRTMPPAKRRAMGLLTAPEERLGHAAAPGMSLVENAVLTARDRKALSPKGFIRWGKSRRFALEVIEAFDVRTLGPHVAARSLSGGNLQKFVIGREVLQEPRVLVVNQPTWGVDAAAAAAIRQALIDLAEKGCAVVVISQDLDELLEVSDRFAALNEGTLSPAVPTRGLSVERIGLMLGGQAA